MRALCWLVVAGLIATACAGADTVSGPSSADSDGQGLPAGGAHQAAASLHGRSVVETQCSGRQFRRFNFAHFGFSLPVSLDQVEQVGFGDNLGVFVSEDFEVSFDYGKFAVDPAHLEASESEDISFSGVSGTRTLVEDNEGWYGNNLVGVFFEDVTVDGESNRLNLVALYPDPADADIGRCIVDSLEWNFDSA